MFGISVQDENETSLAANLEKVIFCN